MWLAVKSAVLAGCLAAGMAFVSPASAVTISIGLQSAGVDCGSGVGNIHTIASGPNSVTGTGSCGSFDTNSVTGSGSPPLTTPNLLGSTALNIASTSGGSLNVYVTSSGITSPTGLLEFASSFTSNILAPGWTLTEQTFLSAANGVYATTTLLGSAVFTNIGTSLANLVANAGSGPYSVTEEYSISAPGAGQALATINISAVPLPTSFPLLMTALVALGFFSWRRKTRASSFSGRVV